MRWYGWLALMAGVAVALSGCRVVEDLEEEHAAPPAKPGAQALAPAASSPAAQTSGGVPSAPKVPAEAPPAGVSAPGGSVLDAVGAAAAEAAGHAGDTSGLGAGVMGKVRAASRESLKAAAEAAELARYRAEADREREELQRRRRTYLQAARWHFQYVQLRVQEQDVERASTQLALLQHSLDGVRSNLGQGVAADELAFALAQLYDLDTVNRNQDEAVAAALGHLRRAQRALPVVPAGQAPTSVKPADEAKEAAKDKSDKGAVKNVGEAVRPDDPAAVARETAEIIALFDQKQKRTGRDRLQALVGELSEEQPLALLKMAEAVRDSTARAVDLRAWRRAAWGLERLSKLLDELKELVGAEPAQPAAPSRPVKEPSKAPAGGSAGSTAPKAAAPKGEAAPKGG